MQGDILCHYEHNMATTDLSEIKAWIANWQQDVTRWKDTKQTFVMNDLNLKKVEESISSLKTIFAMMKPTHLETKNKKVRLSWRI